MKRVIVTGGSSGIGLAVRKGLHQRGASTYDFSRTSKVDVRDARALARAYDAIGEPSPSLLVCCAGVIAPGEPFPNADVSAWREVININVTGLFLTVQEHVRRLGDRPGRIILFTSPSAKRPSMENTAYGVSKAAVTAFGLGIARGLEPRVKVYILSPSHVDTPMLRSRGFGDLDDRALLSPESIATFTVDLLLNDEPPACDGQVIHLGGEVRMKQS